MFSLHCRLSKEKFYFLKKRLSLLHLQVGRKYQLFLPKFWAGSEKGKELKNFTYNSNFPSVRKNLSWQLKRPQLAWSTDTQTLLWLKSEESKAKSGPRGDAATSTPPITPFSVRTAPNIPSTEKPFYILSRKLRLGEIHSATYIYQIPNSLFLLEGGWPSIIVSGKEEQNRVTEKVVDKEKISTS